MDSPRAIAGRDAFVLCFGYERGLQAATLSYSILTGERSVEPAAGCADRPWGIARRGGTGGGPYSRAKKKTKKTKKTKKKTFRKRPWLRARREFFARARLVVPAHLDFGVEGVLEVRKPRIRSPKVLFFLRRRIRLHRQEPKLAR